jgi:nucleolysin TIA-1/TIAR
MGQSPYQQMPNSAGGFGRGNQGGGQWAPTTPGGFAGNMNNGFGGYQG